MMRPLARKVPQLQAYGQICASCRRALGLRELHHTTRIRDKRRTSYIALPGGQASPLAGYYADMLGIPSHDTASSTRKPSSPPEERVLSDMEERQAKAQLVFGSRLAGPIERRKKIESQSTLMAGILVPPKPLEPDNCCMSGCVNCVWDQYRDEVEDWAAKSALAREKMSAQKKESKRERAAGIGGTSGNIPAVDSTSMDDDGGGSEALWTMGSAVPEDLFGGIPVGIREFMKTEKNLQSKHRAERASAAQ